jgi:hypothetical protein
VAFVVFAYFEEAGMGLVATALVGWLVPLVRMRFPRGYAWHVGWALGLIFNEVGMFSLRRVSRVFGP